MTSGFDQEDPPGGGWGSADGYLPPPAAPKPGLIALQPLTAGSMVEAAVSFIRRQPRTVLGIALICAFLAAFGNLIGTAFFYPELSSGLDQLEGLAADPQVQPTAAQLTDVLGPLMAAVAGMTAIVFAFWLLGYTIAQTMLIRVLGRDVLGQPTTVGEAWRLGRAQLARVCLQNLAVLGITVGVSAVMLTPAMLFAVAAGPTAAAALLVLTAPALVFVLLAVIVRLLLAGPALLLEDLSVTTSLQRSWRLVRGSYWRVLGLLLLGAVLTQVAASVIAMPFSLIAGGLSVSASGLVNLTTGSVFVSSLGTVVSTMLTAPALIAMVGLVYLDRRIRTENLDQTLAAHARAIGTLPPP